MGEEGGHGADRLLRCTEREGTEGVVLLVDRDIAKNNGRTARVDPVVLRFRAVWPGIPYKSPRHLPRRGKNVDVGPGG